MYRISLWDHDKQEWSTKLATTILGQPAARLSRAKTIAALATLIGGWSELSIVVSPVGRFEHDGEEEALFDAAYEEQSRLALGERHG